MESSFRWLLIFTRRRHRYTIAVSVLYPAPVNPASCTPVHLSRGETGYETVSIQGDNGHDSYALEETIFRQDQAFRIALQSHPMQAKTTRMDSIDSIMA